MFTNFRKETSERSDAQNWAKQSLIQNTPFHFDSIEGCNENSKNVATHMMERARVDYDGHDNMGLDDVCTAITQLEGEDVLQRKINFAKAFQLNLSYVLYNDETRNVWLYEFEDLKSLKFVQSFETFVAFSNWIAGIKGWKSTKGFREIQDLPLFDKELRRAGTAWPTNIDCFVSDENNQPIGILEFQNADTVSVRNHCNNEFFLCKQSYTNQYGYPAYHDDIRRWLSQEILRLQSCLRLFVITWEKNSEDYVLKEIDSVTFPDLPYAKDWAKTNRYKALMHYYSNTRDKKYARVIATEMQSYNLVYDAPKMDIKINRPPLSGKQKTFPFIYYKFKYKWWEAGNGKVISDAFIELINP